MRQRSLPLGLDRSAPAADPGVGAHAAAEAMFALLTAGPAGEA